MDSHRTSPAEHPVPLSERLVQIIAETGPDRLSFTELAAQLHGRAWGGLLFIFAAINMLPLPPGTSAFFAIPILLVAGQMVFGRASPWFPARLDRRGVTKNELQKLVSKIGWLEARVERLFKPRLPQFTGTTAARLIGIVCFLLALVAAIPIPLFHVAPATAIVLFGLALIYRDGALVIAAAIAAILSILFDGLIVGSGFVALKYAAAWLKP
ncbi:MAG TPA: exopolysaccharide biosynthesis protein [Sphingomicrobium sp.]|nr:exopolysaccharide biosynthesis protein [Sphingomicrobium sp.]